MSAPLAGPPAGDGSALLFPVGLLTGTFPSQDGGHHHEVRRGARIHELSSPELAAWTLAHGPPEAASAGPPDAGWPPPPAGPADVDQVWTRGAMQRRLAGPGVDDPAALVDGLLDRGLLAETPTTGDLAVRFARGHRAVPTMYGLGNSSEDPARYGIGPLGQEVVQVSWPVYELWAWGHLDADLWQACEAFAGQERAAGGTDPVVADPTRVLAGFLGMLHGLLSTQAVYLDPARAEAA